MDARIERQLRAVKRMTPQHGRFDNDYCVRDANCVVRRQLLRENSKLRNESRAALRGDV